MMTHSSSPQIVPTVPTKPLTKTTDENSLETPEEADIKWKDAFANTTDEQFDWLEEMFLEEEKQGLMPLDFTEK